MAGRVLPLALVVAAAGACSSASSPGAGSPPPASHPASAPPPVGARPPARLLIEPFGGERWGFVEASSGSGRTVILRRFQGSEPPSFGHHGEVGGTTELVLFDRVRDSEVPIDDLIDVAPGRRWMLLLNGGELWLLDGDRGRWDELRRADPESDGNACLAPRQAGFSAAGKRLGWIAAGSRAIQLRDLASGDEWTIRVDRKVWRAWPLDDARSAVLATVPPEAEGWPKQRTSCACRWCNRFAASYGNYGWGGPDFTLETVDEKGVRSPSSGPPDGERQWHGKTGTGCSLEPASSEGNLDRGPWRWRCP